MAMFPKIEGIMNMAEILVFFVVVVASYVSMFIKLNKKIGAHANKKILTQITYHLSTQ